MSNQVETKVAKKTGLGRGLGSLLGGMDEENERLAHSRAKSVEKNEENNFKNNILLIDRNKIYPNPDQPRKTFNQEKLQELANSIKEKGILQPLIAKKTKNGFEIVVGERRWRASELAGLKELPVIVKELDNQDTLEVALIENIQRHDLNPVEEAKAYQVLSSKYELSHQEIAKRVGKDRVTVSNSIRLLQLDHQILEFIENQKLSMGHAKVLLALKTRKDQLNFTKSILKEKLSVRALEKLVQRHLKNPEGSTSEKAPIDVPVNESLIRVLSQELQKNLGTKVKIDYSKKGGKIQIYYYTDDQLTQLVERIGNHANPSRTK